jgi:hypothetical protein
MRGWQGSREAVLGIRDSGAGAQVPAPLFVSQEGRFGRLCMSTAPVDTQSDVEYNRHWTQY